MAESSYWQRVQEVFQGAVDRPPEKRAALLAEACGDDAELRAEVESLLEHDSKVTDDFLRPPEPPSSVRQPDHPDRTDPLIGATVGRYHVESRMTRAWRPSTCWGVVVSSCAASAVHAA